MGPPGAGLSWLPRRFERLYFALSGDRSQEILMRYTWKLQASCRRV